MSLDNIINKQNQDALKSFAEKSENNNRNYIILIRIRIWMKECGNLFTIWMKYEHTIVRNWPQSLNY